MHLSKYRSRIAIVALVVCWGPVARAASYAVVPEESVFAVITHKSGVAARFAHNHIIAPKQYTCRIEASGDAVEALQCELHFPVTALVADAPAAQKQWFPALKAVGILEEAFPEVSESDRATITEHMLAKGQLDAKTYPEISAKLTGLKRAPSKRGDTSFAWIATIALTVHGKTVEREMPANISLEAGVLTAEACGGFRFTEFGIAPYSAYFGAVKNQDGFDVYVRVKAQEKPATATNG